MTEKRLTAEHEADLRAWASEAGVVSGERGVALDLLAELDATRADLTAATKRAELAESASHASSRDTIANLHFLLEGRGRDLAAAVRERETAVQMGEEMRRERDAALSARDRGDEGTGDKPLDQPPWDDEGPDLDRYLAQMDAAVASLPGGRWDWCSLANENGETPRSLSGMLRLVEEQLVMGDSAECFLVTTESDGVAKIVAITGNGHSSANHAAVIAGLRRAAPWLVRLVREQRAALAAEKARADSAEAVERFETDRAERAIAMLAALRGVLASAADWADPDTSSSGVDARTHVLSLRTALADTAAVVLAHDQRVRAEALEEAAACVEADRANADDYTDWSHCVMQLATRTHALSPAASVPAAQSLESLITKNPSIGIHDDACEFRAGSDCCDCQSRVARPVVIDGPSTEGLVPGPPLFATPAPPERAAPSSAESIALALTTPIARTDTIWDETTGEARPVRAAGRS